MPAWADYMHDELTFVTILAGSTVDRAGEGSDRTYASGLLQSDLCDLYQDVEALGGLSVLSEDGEGIALFGWPEAMEDHADRAVQAAWRIAAAASERGLRIGVHSGLMDAARLDRLANGATKIDSATLRRAKALRDGAGRGAALVSAATIELCRGEIATRSAGDGAFALTAPPASARATKLANGDAAMVGRARELAAIKGFLAAPEAKTLALIGEPGIGKSRLLAEAAAAARADGHRIVTAFAAPENRHDPFAILRELAEACLSDAPDRQRGDIQGDARHKAMLAALDELANGAKRAPQGRDYRALSDAFAFAALGGAVALLVEDLHYADEESLRTLRRLAADHGGAGFKLLVTARPEAKARAAALGAKALHLAPLSEAALARQARRMAAGRTLNASTIRRLAARSGGVPLYLEQSVHAAAAAGEAAVADLPAGLQSMVHARLNAFSPDVRRAAQHLGALGLGVERHVARRVLDLDETSFRVTIGPLIESEIIARDASDRVAFRHAKLAEACASMLSEAAQKQMNARAAGAIIELYGETEDQFGRLAHFEERAGEAERALHWLILECRRVQKLQAHGALVGLFERAIACVDEIGAAGEARLPDFANAAFATLIQLGEIDLMRRCLPKIIRATELYGDAKALCAANCSQGLMSWFDGAFEDGADISRRALAEARGIGHMPLILAARFNLSTMLFGLGDIAGAARLLNENLAVLKDAAKGSNMGYVARPHSISRSYLAWYHAEAGAVKTADNLAREALAHAVDAGDAYAECLACVAIGRVGLTRGRNHQAASALSDAIGIAERFGYDAVLPGTIGLRLSALTRAGREEDAAALFGETKAALALPRTGAPERHAYQLGLAEFHCAYGRRREGAAAFAKATALAEVMKSPVHRRATAEVGGRHGFN